MSQTPRWVSQPLTTDGRVVITDGNPVLDTLLARLPAAFRELP